MSNTNAVRDVFQITQIHDTACYLTVPAVLWSCGIQVDFYLWFWGLRVSVRDGGGSRVTEDKGPIVEWVFHSRLDLANVIQDSPQLSLAFGSSFSQDYGS